MIVRKNLKLSIVWQLAWRSLLFFAIMAILVALLESAGLNLLDIEPATVGPLGTALAIFLAFRNASAYDRWWQARKLWGALVNNSRTLARQIMTFVAPGDDSPAATALRRSMIHRQIAYAHALRASLRKQPDSLIEPLTSLVAADERARIVRARSVPTVVLQLQGQALAGVHAAGGLNTLHHVELERTLAAITDVQGGCERIKNTPLLRPYDYYPRIFVYVYGFFLPFAIVQQLGWLTAIVSMPVSFLFFALSRVGASTEDRFEGRFTDVPLDALCRTIEISLREQAGESDIPRALEPIDGFLS